MDSLLNKLFNISSEEDFADVCLRIFQYQAINNNVYSKWISELGIKPQEIRDIADIPFIPISMFRDQRIICDGFEEDLVFVSSGTTGMRHSSHYIADAGLYSRSFTEGFKLFYGDPRNYYILALLPSYLERNDSSLVYMADSLIRMSGSELSGFFLNEYDILEERLNMARKGDRKILLLGVSFALLDLAERGNIDLHGHIIMETGGMKGRRKEMVREELHDMLMTAFNIRGIHSEYGMTELLSQAYSEGNGIFKSPPWMKILIRDPHDPFGRLPQGRTGGIDIIDLANIYSCSFIASSDLGRSYPDGSFEVVGRFDNSDIRGCNLMMV